jgi:hypothetical protein
MKIPAKYIRSSSSSVNMNSEHKALVNLPSADDESSSSSVSVDSDEITELPQPLPHPLMSRRPRFFLTQVISLPTLYVERLPVSLQNNSRLLRESVQFPQVMLREGFSVLCGKRAVRLTLKLNEEHTFPLELEQGLNILTWATPNLRIHPSGVGSSRTFGEARDGNFLSFYLDGNYQLVGLDGKPLLQPIFNYYILGERPKKSGIVKPFPRPERVRGRGDWRLKNWEKSLSEDEWPLSAPVFFYDCFVHNRDVHTCDFMPTTSWPLLKRQFS